MGDYLFEIDDKVNIKYQQHVDYSYTTYKILERKKMTMEGGLVVNIYVIESTDITPTQERYIDEIYLKYDKIQLRKLKLNRLFNVES